LGYNVFYDGFSIWLHLGKEKKIIWRVMPKLMADPDPEVWKALLLQFIDSGVGALPYLEKIWENTMQDQVQRRAEEAINAIRRQNTLLLLQDWLKKPENLSLGMGILHRHFFPHLDWEKLIKRLKTWVSYLPEEHRNSGNSAEKIKLLNHLLYEVKGLRPVENSGFSHCFMHTLMENRKGNSSIHVGLYLLAGLEIRLQLGPAKIPGSCLLRWERPAEAGWAGNDVKNFVSPYGQGATFSERELEHYFKQRKQEWWLQEPVGQHAHVFWMQAWLEEMKSNLEKNKSGLFYEDVRTFHLGIQGL